MAKGLSIHLGINYVDRHHYGSFFALPYCVNDAVVMQEIADSNGFESYLLTNEKATSTNLFYFLDYQASRLEGGDILFISFSGHGSFLQDLNGDEREDGYDEALLFYDRMVVDDQFALQWTKFQPGVRILFISDACHCGSVIKDPLSHTQTTAGPFALPVAHKEVLKKVYMNNQKSYDASLKNIPSSIRSSIDCSVLLLAACQDDQTAGAGGDGKKELSTFTEFLVSCWDNGRFDGSYYTLHALICDVMREQQITQRPNYFTTGRVDLDFQYSRPFTI